MANVKIAELPSAESIDVDNDFLVLDQTGGTKKATPVQVFDKKTITYETWQGYTDEQKQSFNGYVTGVPGASLTYAENCILSSGDNVDNAIENITSDLSELINDNFGTSITITSYTSADNPYIFPSDGYLILYALPNSVVHVKINNSMEAIAAGTTGNYQVQNIYVRKGMRVQVINASASCLVLFVPFAS